MSQAFGLIYDVRRQTFELYSNEYKVKKWEMCHSPDPREFLFGIFKWLETEETKNIY